MWQDESMKKMIPLLAALTFVPGCRDKCLEQNYTSALQIVREFNQGRCQSVFNSDQRDLKCPTGILRGRVNSHVFELEMECGQVQIQMQEEAGALVCGHNLQLTTGPEFIAMRDQFEEILSQLEVD
jgi:hypothetical protein